MLCARTRAPVPQLHDVARTRMLHERAEFEHMLSCRSSSSHVLAVIIITQFAARFTHTDAFVRFRLLVCVCVCVCARVQIGIIVLYSGYRKQAKMRKLGHKWSKWMPDLLK
jgi:hypothetical protein